MLIPLTCIDTHTHSYTLNTCNLTTSTFSRIHVITEFENSKIDFFFLHKYLVPTSSTDLSNLVWATFCDLTLLEAGFQGNLFKESISFELFFVHLSAVDRSLHLMLVSAANPLTDPTISPRSRSYMETSKCDSKRRQFLWNGELEWVTGMSLH